MRCTEPGDGAPQQAQYNQPHQVLQLQPQQVLAMSTSDHYCLKWNTHWANLVSVFNSLLESETFVDVTLACEGRHIKAHRLVLSACSPYFHQLLVAHEERHPIVILKGVHFTDLRVLIEFIYNGTVSVDRRHLGTVLGTARELQIKGLADHFPPSGEESTPPANEVVLLPGDQSSEIRALHTDTFPDIRVLPNEEASRTPVRVPSTPGEVAVDSPSSAHQQCETPPAPKRIRLAQLDERMESPDRPQNGMTHNVHLAMVNNSTEPPMPCNDTNVQDIENIPSVRSTIEVEVEHRELKMEDDSDEDSGAMRIQSPEVIFEEGETHCSDTDTPSSVTSCGGGIHVGGPLPASGNSLSQMALLQQAISAGSWHPLYGPRGVLMDCQRMGMPMAKNFAQFMSMIKSMGAKAGIGVTDGGHSSVSGGAGGIPDIRPSGHNNGNLTCHICAMNLPSSEQLEEHVRIHEEEKPFKCDQCGQRYKYQSAFQRHQEQNHTAKLPGDKPFRCEVCGQCFKYHKSFAKHRSNHDMLERIMKGDQDSRTLGLLQETYLRNFLGYDPTAGDPTVKVKMEEVEDRLSEDGEERAAGTSFNAAMVGKLKSENGGKKEELEEGEVPDDEDLDDLEEEEENSGRFIYCTRCKLTFRDVGSFQEHCHTSLECSTESLREISVNNDTFSISRPPSCASSSSPPTLSPGGNRFPPPVQHSSPLHEAFGFPHHSLHHSSFNNSSSPNSSPLVLPNGPPGPSFMRTHHNMLPSFFLPQSMSTLTDPRGGGPEEERPFKCPFCTKGFKGRENLKLHIRTHTGEKPYTCGVCGKAFGGRSDMNRHLRIHTGEKPYPCKVCGKKFARADYLSKHITTHLGIPFAKPVHSLQQSLLNLENMQRLQELHMSQQQDLMKIPGAGNGELMPMPSLSSVGMSSGLTREYSVSK